MNGRIDCKLTQNTQNARINSKKRTTKHNVLVDDKKFSLHNFTKPIIFKKNKQNQPKKINSLGSFATDTARQLDVFGHERDALGVHRAQVWVFKQADQIGLASLPASNVSK